ncbi:MAG TPA: glycoside hydrolase 100 family protein [Burkholderiales bacterium]|nr:glycoside hydrolase 100 family protein [Burkholderiales bacterium]
MRSHQRQVGNTRAAAALIENCEREALALLRENLSPEGILAAGRAPVARERNYESVFARDASICALAMALSGDRVLERGAAASLASLASRQAANGQIPNYVDGAARGDFWYVGCIDASLWWLIALEWLQRRGVRGLRGLGTHARRALHWLRCQEHPGIALLAQNEASDWADIMPRSGFVLYSNALWYRVKRLYGLPGAELTRRHFEQLFHPTQRDRPEHRRLRLLAEEAQRRRRHADLYLSYVNLGARGEEGDVFGNILAALMGLAGGARRAAVLRAIARAQGGAPYPVRAVCEPIPRNDARWRSYMGRHRQNLEHQYHNSGVWPMIGGFWVAALAAAGMRQRAQEDLVGLARANAVNGWEFNEWFHGLSGKPRGMPRQSWNAAAFLLARRSLEGKLFDGASG